MNTFSRRLLATLIATAAPAALAGGNWVVNGGFETDFSGWHRTLGNKSSWGAHDEEGYGTPGSVVINVGFPGDSISFSRCVALADTRVDFVFYSKVIITGGGPNIGSGMLTFFTEPDCVGYMSGSAQRVTEVEEAEDGWVRQSLLGHEVPAGAVSAMVFVDNSVSGPWDRSVMALFDDVYVGAAQMPDDTLFVNGFEN